MAIDLHFVCKQGLNHRCVDRDTKVYESGNWIVADETANKAVGGRLYLHESRAADAWHGGTIVSWTPAANEPGRKVFRYRVEGPFRVRLREGWGQEKAIVTR